MVGPRGMRFFLGHFCGNLVGRAGSKILMILLRNFQIFPKKSQSFSQGGEKVCREKYFLSNVWYKSYGGRY